MSSFPKHVDNIENMKNLGFDVGDCYENGEVTLESWGYDYLVDLMSDLIGRIQQLEQDNEDLRHDIARQVAISSELATENAEMLEMLEESLRFIPFEYYNKKEEIRALIAKIESQKEGE